MIISHKYKFIFIKTRKVGGTSVQYFLSELCGPDDIVYPTHPILSKNETVESMNYKPRNFSITGMGNHMRPKDIKAVFGEELWNNYYKFTIDRNPWDKVLSMYWNLKYEIKVLTLEDYFERVKKNEQFWGLNYPQYTDECTGDVCVDKIIRYENLKDELQKVCIDLGMNPIKELDYRIKGNYRQDRRHYTEVFTDEQAKIIEEVFKKEIELHNYTYK